MQNFYQEGGSTCKKMKRGREKGGWMRHVILNFHGIGQPARMLERGEISYWISQDFFSSVLALADSLKDRVQTSFTFDDGNLSDLEIGAEGLARYGHRGHFFVLSGRIGQSGSLGVDDIRRLQAVGHKIGNHGADHVDWRAAAPDDLAKELDTARSTIEAITGQRVRAAAIPFGLYNASVLRSLRERGYERVYSSDGGAWSSRQWPIPRTSPRSDMDIQHIENILLGREPRLQALRRVLAVTVKRNI
jgi:peptidoglycan/xylan/chitin deacetylase (PgdA/CDA1 family)